MDMGTNKRSLFLDFEFNETKNPLLNLVSCCTLDPQTNEIKDWWLHYNPKAQKELSKYLRQFDLLEGFSSTAEARSLISLGLDPLNWEWTDYYLEYRCLSNHYDEFNYGEQLVDGKIKNVRKKNKWRPEPDEDEGEEGSGFKPTFSLAEATFKLLHEIRDTAEKDQVRDLIISSPSEFSSDEQSRILRYGREDVIYLPRIKEAIISEYQKRDSANEDLEQLLQKFKTKGRFAAVTAWQEAKGYPIDLEKTKNFSKQVASILIEMQLDINDQFPTHPPFKWDRKMSRFKWDQTTTKQWVRDHHVVSEWDTTDKGDVSLALEAFEKFYPFKHDYPRENFGAQMVRFLKLRQSLYGFVPTATGKSKKNFWDSVGPDGRVRPYLNPYGAQSSRSQPAATGFMYLKPAWMRALVQPAPGKFMAAIDYGSQEFFVAALLARDEAMIQAYLSGDPYLEFAKLAGMVPQNGTKAEYPREREICKSTVLGISYMMSKFGLARKLTTDTGRPWTEDEAQAMINTFYGVFWMLQSNQKYIEMAYKQYKHIELQDGWYMWGDNPNMRSVGNMPVQGAGGVAMRKSVIMAFERGLYIPFALHDADYMEDDVGQEKKIVTLRECMREAFVDYFDDTEIKKLAENIRLDAKAWSPDYKDGDVLDFEGWKVPQYSLHIDPRAKEDYKRFSKYFESPDINLI